MDSLNLAWQGGNILGQKTVFLKNMHVAIVPIMRSSCSYPRSGIEERNEKPRRSGPPVECVLLLIQLFLLHVHLANWNPVRCVVADSFIRYECVSTMCPKGCWAFLLETISAHQMSVAPSDFPRVYLHTKWVTSSRSSRKEINPCVLGHWNFCLHPERLRSYIAYCSCNKWLQTRCPKQYKCPILQFSRSEVEQAQFQLS